MSITQGMPTKPFMKNSELDHQSRPKGCYLCPRGCGQDRTADYPGFCGADEGMTDFRVARLMPHHWEEPFFSGRAGSGTIFFSGCGLGCCFCQNHEISHGRAGVRMTPAQLTNAAVLLLDKGVHNLNLVTPSHYADRIPSWLSQLYEHPVYQNRRVPVIWNSSAYETVKSLRALQGLVSIYLPDMKFWSSELSTELANAPNYAQVALSAIREMQRQQPEPVYSDEGLMLSGVVVRHLVLPSQYQDSCRILEELATFLPKETPLSLMSQYTPQYLGKAEKKTKAGRWIDAYEKHPELKRRLTTWEYRKVLDCALDLGFTRILSQDRSSADRAYTPDFDERFRPGRI